MSKFNKKVESEKVTNYMGGRAFKQSPKEELAMVVLTTFVESSYYESTDDRVSRIVSLIKKVGKKDPEFIAKLAVYARTQFHMRSVFPILVGELSKLDSVKGTSWVRRALYVGTTRVDDLLEVASYIGPKNMRTCVKRGINDALGKFDEYQFAKYKNEGKKLSLVDLVNLTHPKPNQKNETALKKLVAGTLKNVDTWEAKLSSGQNKAEAFHELIDNGRIPYMALLRNLRNIAQTGDSSLCQKAADMIKNPDFIRKSKQLPFRFLSAYNALDNMSNPHTRSSRITFEKDTGGFELLKKAVEEAVTISVKNIPLLSGRTMILSDNSGSMFGDGGGSSATSAMSNVKSADIANLFASLYWLRADNTYIGLFGDRLITPKLSREDTVFETYKNICRAANGCGGATETGIFQAMEDLIAGKIQVDRVVIFSDCQVGCGCGWYTRPEFERSRRSARSGGDFNNLFKLYKTKVNPDVKVYSVDLRGYGNSMFDQGVMKLAGWSDKIFDIMEKNELEAKALIGEIESVQL